MGAQLAGCLATEIAESKQKVSLKSVNKTWVWGLSVAKFPEILTKY